MLYPLHVGVEGKRQVKIVELFQFKGGKMEIQIFIVMFGIVIWINLHDHK